MMLSSLLHRLHTVGSPAADYRCPLARRRRSGSSITIPTTNVAQATAAIVIASHVLRNQTSRPATHPADSYKSFRAARASRLRTRALKSGEVGAAITSRPTISNAIPTPCPAPSPHTSSTMPPSTSKLGAIVRLQAATRSPVVSNLRRSRRSRFRATLTSPIRITGIIDLSIFRSHLDFYA